VVFCAPGLEQGVFVGVGDGNGGYVHVVMAEMLRAPTLVLSELEGCKEDGSGLFRTCAGHDDENMVAFVRASAVYGAVERYMQ
jgi:hypothetical protein